MKITLNVNDERRELDIIAIIMFPRNQQLLQHLFMKKKWRDYDEKRMQTNC